MATFVSAGVFIQEKDDSLYAPAISPTIIGIVGSATKGTLNEATLVTNEGQLVDTFGKPRSKDLGMHAAIEALKACRLVYFVRVAGGATTSGSVTVLDDGSLATPASIGPSSNGETYNFIGAAADPSANTKRVVLQLDYNNGAGLQSNVTDNFDCVRATTIASGNTETYDLNAIDSGNPVNLTVRVDGGVVQTITFASTDPLISAFAAVTAEEVVNVINQQLVGGAAELNGAGTAVLITSDTYGSDSIIQVTGGNANDVTNGLNFGTGATTGSGDAGDMSAVTGAEIETWLEASTGLNAVAGDLLVTVGSGGEITIRTANTGAGVSLNIDSAQSTMIGASPLINLTPLDSTQTGAASGAAANTMTFTAATPGSWSSRLSVRVTASTALAGTIKLEVLLDGVLVETFDKLDKTGVSGAEDIETVINTGTSTQGPSEFITASDAALPGTGNPAVGTATLSAGTNGDTWTSGSVIGTTVGAVSTGMQIFRDPDNIFINILATPGFSYAAVIAEGLDICSTRGDCLYIADAPKELTPQEVTDWHNGDNSITVKINQEDDTETNSTTFNSSYGALYWNWITIFDKFNDANILAPPSALILRTIAHTDNVADPWFAPAGPNRTQAQAVLALEYKPSLGERDLMQLPGNNVNPIANIAGVGTTIMGQKTLQRAPTALDRVNVRRLLLAAEKVVAQAVFFLIFEPNDAIMWRRFVNLVTPVFEDIKARRGVYDFRVIMDSSTTTDLLIDQNTAVGKIFLQPTKAAEKIIVSFNLVPTGANFEEFAAS
jgi:phage tail sheath protein FI